MKHKLLAACLIVGAGLPRLYAGTETLEPTNPPPKPAPSALPDVPVALPQQATPARPGTPKIESKKEEPVGEGDVRLSVVFDDIQRLQEAARRQGGRLVVSFTPVGITTEDLLSELKRDGYFSLSYRKSGTVEVYSPDLGIQKRKLADEIEELRRRRNELLRDDRALKGFVDASSAGSAQSEKTTLGNFDPMKAGAAPVADNAGQ